MMTSDEASQFFLALSGTVGSYLLLRWSLKERSKVTSQIDKLHADKKATDTILSTLN